MSTSDTRRLHQQLHFRRLIEGGKQMQHLLDLAIMAVPTGPEREKLTEVNIEFQGLLGKLFNLQGKLL